MDVTEKRAWTNAAVLFFLILPFALSGCSVNILENFANKKSNGALYYDAQKAMDAHDYDGALAKIVLMTGTYATSTPVLVLKASAYGGLCGFDFLTFAKALQGIGATRVFPFLLANFDAASATAIDNCVLAQNTILSIGSLAERSDDNNFFLAMIVLAKIGNILSYNADAARAGTGLAGFDPCAAGGARAMGGPMTDGDARELGVGIALAATNLTAVAGKVSAGSGVLSNIASVCSALPVGYNFCAVTDPAALTASEVKGVRTLVKENSVIGLGTNCTGDVSACNCP